MGGFPRENEERSKARHPPSPHSPQGLNARSGEKTSFLRKKEVKKELFASMERSEERCCAAGDRCVIR